MYGEQKGKILLQPFAPTGVAVNVSQMVRRRPEDNRRDEESDGESRRRIEESGRKGVLQLHGSGQAEVFLGKAVRPEEAEEESGSGKGIDEPLEKGGVSLEYQDDFDMKDLIRRKKLEELENSRWEI